MDSGPSCEVSYPLNHISIPAMVKSAAANGNFHNGSYKPDDLESAISSNRRKLHFRDVVNLARHDNFHAELKRKLKDEVDRKEFEHFRKSQAELDGIKDKRIRAFYEEQNERLNDWLEVDTLVTSMADDVLDSMNPHDVCEMLLRFLLTAWQPLTMRLRQTETALPKLEALSRTPVGE